MTASNRASQITKLHTALKKRFKPIPAADGRPLMEHLLYASLLEDAPPELADEALAKLEQDFFDWNEVRVTTVTELSEVLSHLPDPVAAATRLKRNLQGVFETFYTFEIDELKKQNLGQAVAKFENLPGMTPFVLAYVVQHGLGGHAIPVDRSALRILFACEIVSEKERDSGKVPGLERAIPKSKGIEFGSLLHQAAAVLRADLDDKAVRSLIESVHKEGLDRLDEATAQRKQRAAARTAAKKKRTAQRKAAKAEAAAPPADAPKSTAKGKKKAAPKTDADKSQSAKSQDTKPSDGAKSAGAKSAKKPAAVKKTPAKKPASGSSAAKTGAEAAKTGAEAAKPAAKGSSKRLTKRKPR